MSSLCRQVADERQWDGWLTQGLPEAVRMHAATCAQCAAVVADLERLGGALQGLSAETMALAEAMDIRSAVLGSLDASASEAGSVSTSASVSTPRRRRGVGWAYGGLALAATVLLSLRLLGPSNTVFVEAGPGATWVPEGGRAELLRGGVQVRLPGRLVADTADLRVLDQGMQVMLRSGAELTWLEPLALKDLVGGMQINSDSPFSMSGSSFRLEGAGLMDVATGDVEIGKMVNKKGILGSAVVVALVYSGWASFETKGTPTKGEAPIGLAVSSGGGVSSFALPAGRGPGQAGSAGVGTAAQALVAGAQAEADAASPPSGAYWSEEDQAVRFALEGEVIDATSGAPVRDFTLAAEVQDQAGYGAQRHERSVAGAEQGHFRLDGLALGRWRVTARAKGYAPVSQTVDLREVGADPYVVLPLSGGAQLSGQVVDSRRQPVAEARVGLVECFGNKGAAARDCDIQTTGADGRFVLKGVPSDEVFAVRAEHERQGSVVQPGLRRAEEESEHIVLELSGRLRVFGRVTRGPDQAPQAGVRVVSGDESVSTLTDAQGAYSMLMPLENRPKVHVEVQGSTGPSVKFGSYPERRSSEVIRWVSERSYVAEVEKNFRLAVDDARLFGQITDASGAPLAGVQLRLWNTTGWYGKDRGHETFPERTTTDADGRYAIEGVPIKAGYTMAYVGPDERQVDLGYVNVKDAEDVQADFQLGGGRIRGQMVDTLTGQPFRIARQACGSMFGAERVGPHGYFAAPECLADGRFEFEGLPPGTYRLHAKMDWTDANHKFEATEVTVGPKEVVSDVQVKVTGEQADDWRLRVLDGQGRFVSGLYLRMQAKNRTYTSNLNLGSDGVVRASVSRSFTEVYIDAQGYESAKVDLRGRNPAELIELHLRRVSSAPSAE